MKIDNVEVFLIPVAPDKDVSVSCVTLVETGTPRFKICFEYRVISES